MRLLKSKRKRSYKALIIDIDGTLVSTFNSQPSKRVTNAIKKAARKIHVGLATSRPLVYSSHIIDYLSLSGPSIFSNGAEIVDATTKKILYDKPISQEAMEKIIQFIEKEKVDVLINEDGTDIKHKKRATYKRPLDLWFFKLTQNERDTIIKHLSRIPSIFYWHGVSRIGGFDIVVTHASATKQHGILHIAKILNVKTDDIIGIGDGPNDFPLLMACGLRVAMGNADPGLKEIADYVAPTVQEDGVAHVIEKFILN